MNATAVEQGSLPIGSEKLFRTLSDRAYPGKRIELITVPEYFANPTKNTINPSRPITDFDSYRVVPISVGPYHQMSAEGILPEGSPIELLRGVLHWKDRRAMNNGEPWPTPLVALTTHDYLKMIRSGIILEGAPIELMDGLLVWKDRSAPGKDPMSIGELHNYVVKMLFLLDGLIRGQGVHLQIQGPIILPGNAAPEPDAAIILGEPKDYLHRLPEQNDVLCALEVSDSTLLHDRTHKLRIYAASGIPQFILINIPDRQIEVYENPSVQDGRYLAQSIARSGDTFSLLLKDNRRVPVEASQILP